MTTTTGVRGCGTRAAGGIYAETQMSPYGRPVEDFLIDPPIVIDADALGLSSIGVTLIEREGVWHVLDWVGSEHYPNVADFVEEVRRMGVSRRLPKTLDFEKLTDESRLVLIHACADIENFQDLVTRGAKLGHEFDCVQAKPEHVAALPEMCAGLWWWDVQDGESTSDGPFTVSRQMPWGSYLGLCFDDGSSFNYRSAIFASFPISDIAVINDPDGGSHEDGVLKASKARGLPVIVEDE